jgi:hypothetical protein
VDASIIAPNGFSNVGAWFLGKRPVLIVRAMHSKGFPCRLSPHKNNHKIFSSRLVSSLSHPSCLTTRKTLTEVGQALIVMFRRPCQYSPETASTIVCCLYKQTKNLGRDDVLA